jgi:hypothetical protein
MSIAVTAVERDIVRSTRALCMLVVALKICMIEVLCCGELQLKITEDRRRTEGTEETRHKFKEDIPGSRVPVPISYARRWYASAPTPFESSHRL